MFTFGFPLQIKVLRILPSSHNEVRTSHCTESQRSMKLDNEQFGLQITVCADERSGGGRPRTLPVRSDNTGDCRLSDTL